MAARPRVSRPQRALRIHPRRSDARGAGLRHGRRLFHVQARGGRRPRASMRVPQVLPHGLPLRRYGHLPHRPCASAVPRETRARHGPARHRPSCSLRHPPRQHGRELLPLRVQGGRPRRAPPQRRHHEHPHGGFRRTVRYGVPHPARHAQLLPLRHSDRRVHGGPEHAAREGVKNVIPRHRAARRPSAGDAPPCHIRRQIDLHAQGGRRHNEFDGQSRRLRVPRACRCRGIRQLLLRSHVRRGACGGRLFLDDGRIRKQDIHRDEGGELQALHAHEPPFYGRDNLLRSNDDGVVPAVHGGMGEGRSLAHAARAHACADGLLLLHHAVAAGAARVQIGGVALETGSVETHRGRCREPRLQRSVRPVSAGRL